MFTYKAFGRLFLSTVKWEFGINAYYKIISKDKILLYKINRNSYYIYMLCV